MLMREIMVVGAAECTEDTPLKDVYELIRNSPSQSVVVLDSSQHRVPLGIVTEHSICESMILCSRTPRSLDAGSVMNTNIRRVCDTTPIVECDELIDSDVIFVVDKRRQFLGMADREELTLSINRERAHYYTPTVFSGLGGKRMPPAVEIPAFGWLK